MVTIDGSRGEGGGQIVRSSLALAALTGQSFTIERVRAGRKKPGLMRQHLTAVRAAAEICNASVDGAEIGSQRLVFKPGRLRGGDFDFRVGTAGSTSLVFQTVLPALLVAGSASRVTLEGGTHNPLAPPFDFLARAFLPIMRRMGVEVVAELERAGFYPAGGGRMRLEIQPPGEFRPLQLLDRGPIVARRVRALVANLPRHIAQRECDFLRERSGWDPANFVVEELRDARGPGNVVLIELEFENVTEVFAGFGEAGVKAEAVADSAWGEAKRYLAAGVPVGEHLADQLLLPLAVSVHHGGPGGEFRTGALSQHATTQIETISAFLSIHCSTERREHDDVLVRIGPAPAR